MEDCLTLVSIPDSEGYRERIPLFQRGFDAGRRAQADHTLHEILAWLEEPHVPADNALRHDFHQLAKSLKERS